jgi:transcriptional regulator GlxA family with amidase domain
MKFKLGVLLFDDVEILDFAGPCEVFSSAKIGEEACFEVVTFGMNEFPTFVRGGVEVISNLTILSHIPLDVVIIPGGDGVQDALGNHDLRQWLTYHKEQGARLASVCTGAFVLAEMGYLNGIQATTHHDDLEALRINYPEIHVVSNVRFVDQGQILTSAGVSAGIELSLHLVEQLCGKEVADGCLKRMEWGW